MPSQKYLKIASVATDYSDAHPVDITWSTSAPAQCSFTLQRNYTQTLPVVGNSVEWFRRDNTKVFGGVITEIDDTGMWEGGIRMAVTIKAVGYDDRLFHRTTWNRATFRCAQFRSFNSTVNTADVTGVGHVYWSSDDRFSVDLIGKTVVINGVNKVVAAVISPEELTLTTTIGTHSGYSFAYIVYSGDVVKYLLDNYADFEGFTYTGTSIQNGAALDSKGVLFDPPVTIHDATQILLGANTDFYFSVDANQVCYFATRTLVSAPGNFTPTSGKQKRSGTTRITAEDVRNVEISTTTFDAVDPIVEGFTGDGTTRSWFTTKPISTVVGVKLNGVAVDFSEGTGGTSSNFYFFQNDSMFWQDVGDPVLGGGDVVEISYKALADNLIEYADNPAQSARATIEGSGLGRYEQSIDRTKFAGKTPALADATSSVNRLKDNYYEVEVSTFEIGYAVGQTFTVNMPKIQAGNLSLFIDEVRATDSATKGNYDFEYTLKCISVSRRITDIQVLRDAFSASSSGASGGTASFTGGTGTVSAPPSVTAVGTPVPTFNADGTVTLTFDITYPGSLGTMTDIYVRIQAPYPGTAVDTSVNVPPTFQKYEQGPFHLVISLGVVQNPQATIVVPAPKAAEVWSLEVATANPTITNPFLGSGSGFITFSIDPTVALVAGSEYAPNPPGDLTVDVKFRVVRGSDQEWRFSLDWNLPASDDPRANLVAKWEISIFDPTITDTLTLDEKIRHVATLAAKVSGRGGAMDVHRYTSEWIRVPDAFVFYRLMVRPITADGKMNSYVPGITCALGVRIGPVSTTVGMEQADLVSGLTASSEWTPDATGARQFTIPVSWYTPIDIRFGGVILYLAHEGEDLPGDPATGVQVTSPFTLTLAQKDAPTNVETWHVTAVSVDKNNDANTYVDGITPSVAFSAVPYNNGAVSGQEYTSQASITSVTIGAQYPAPDGSYRQLITVVVVAPNDTTWGSYDVVFKDGSGNIHVLQTSVRELTHLFLWTPPVGSQTGRFYIVSRDVQGRANTLVDPGLTPHIDKTVGTTSQLDFTAAKLSTLNQSQLRIINGVFEAYNIPFAIFGGVQVGGGTNNGTADSSGTAIHRLSGNIFTSAMNGGKFYFNGTEYKVADSGYIDADHLTLTTSAGSQSGKNWSFGMPPLFKVYDRSNNVIFISGDDSGNTNFVGTWAGVDFRAGGPSVSSPVFEVDGSGAVFIRNAFLQLSHLSGGITNTLTLDESGFAEQLVADDGQAGRLHHRVGLGPSGMSIIGPLSPSPRSGTLTVGENGSGQLQFKSISDLGDYNSLDANLIDNNGLAQLQDGLAVMYGGQLTSGMGLPPIYANVSQTGRTSSIGASNIVSGFTPAAGMYRVSVYLWATVAGLTGLVTLNITFNDGTAARTDSFNISFGALSFGGTSFVIITNGSHPQYSTTFTGTGGAAYSLRIVLEQLA